MKNNLILVLLAALALSCTPKIEPKDADLGKESTADEYNKAIDDAFAGISIGNARIGQYVRYVDNYQIEQGNILTHSLTNQELKDIQINDTAQTVRFVLFRDYWEYELGSEPLKTIDEKHGAYDKEFSTATSPKSFMAKMTTAAEPCDGHDVTDADGDTYDCIKHFNLTSMHMRVTPPAEVRAKPNCMELPDCLMDVHHLKYDQVKWRNGKSISTITIDTEIARDVADLMYDDVTKENLLPPVNKFCVKGLKLKDGRTYSHCTFLLDFK